MRYEPIGFELPPPKLTLTQLQQLAEIVLGTPLDKHNFWKKLLSLDLLIALDEVQKDIMHRAARLYSFDNRRYQLNKQQGFKVRTQAAFPRQVAPPDVDCKPRKETPMSSATTTSQTRSVPDFYNPNQSTEWVYQPDAQALMDHATSWRQQQSIKPAASDRVKIHLLLINVQKDFCFPQGTLYVGGRSGTGAMDHNDRIATFIYRNLPCITDITCTMDTQPARTRFSSRLSG
ncbi:hypothetical protein NKDENANG_03709 [Candidatus Entotheonellaceae bacterium PAL068K]